MRNRMSVPRAETETVLVDSSFWKGPPHLLVKVQGLWSYGWRDAGTSVLSHACGGAQASEGRAVDGICSGFRTALTVLPGTAAV